MDLRRIFVIVRRRLLLLVILVIVGLAAAYLGSSRTARYQAMSTVAVGAKPASADLATQGGQALLAGTLAALVPNPAVIGDALATTKAARSEAEVASSTKAGALPASNLIEITVTDRDPVVAQTLANGIARAFVGDSNRLLPGTDASAAGSSARVAGTAAVPAVPLSTNLDRNVALGGLAGLVVGIAVILLVDFLGLSARTPRQLEAEMDLPVLGIVPFQPQIAEDAASGTNGHGNLLVVGDDA